MSEVLSMGRPWDLARAWERLCAEEPGVRARQWGARLGAFLLGLWLALLASMCAGAETAVRRIVSVGGELTEIVYTLGAEARLVGVDTTSRWPAATHALPKVGYMRTLSAEGVLSLAPTLVLATTHAGPPVVLSQLREAGVPLLILPAGPSLAGAESKIRGVAGALGLEPQGEVLVRTLRSRVERALAGIPAGAGPRVLFLMGQQHGTPVASGVGTSAHAMIELAGGANALMGFSGYRPVSPEALAQARPEVLLVPEHALGAMGGARAILSQPGVELTCAGRNRRLVVMDGLYLLGLGPRASGRPSPISPKPYLLPGTAVLGAGLVVGADLGARTLIAPAELPIGILTSLVGGPFFIWLLWRERRVRGWL